MLFAIVVVGLGPGVRAEAFSNGELQVVWHDLTKELRLEGQGWVAAKDRFDRLPATTEQAVRPPVWNLAHDTPGFRYRFVTNATTIRARWKLRSSRIAMPHMAATGVSGLDLYWRESEHWRWIGVGKPQSTKVNDRLLVQGLTEETREYLLYLPLYNGLESIEIGLPPGATFAVAPDRYAGQKPIVFYGTSITQGGCASRPGMAYSLIIGRRLDWSVVNLGFSGNGKSEPEMAKLLATLDPAIYVIDTLGNLTVAQVGERVEPLVRVLRRAHPATPIVLLEGVHYVDAALVEARRSKVAERNAILREIYERLRAAGDGHLDYVPSAMLLGGDGEDTVDGTHPTDLGHWRMANGMEPIIREALADAGQTVRPAEIDPKRTSRRSPISPGYSPIL